MHVQIIQDGWHMKTCDFLWKYGMIWNSYDRIGLDQKIKSEFLCNAYDTVWV